MKKSGEKHVASIDISERLRLLMRDRGFNVADFAAVAGVSKSAMEKYLAGPSSPRATAIAEICVELGVNAHWLMFGKPDNDLSIIQSAIDSVIVDLLNELKHGTGDGEKFATLEYGNRDWRMYCWQLAEARAREGIERIHTARQHADEDARSGLRKEDLTVKPNYHFPDR